MKRALYFILLVALISSGSAVALEFASMSLEDLYRRSAIVVQVQIKSARLSSISYDDSQILCGITYEADVRVALKGDEEKVEFRSGINLKVGGDYILFLDSDDLASVVNFIAMGRNDEELHSKCVDIGPGLYASIWQGGIFEIYPILAPASDGYQRIDWLKNYSDHLTIDPSITQVQIELKTEGVDDSYVLGELVNYGLYRKDDFLKFINAIRVKLEQVSPEPAN